MHQLESDTSSSSSHLTNLKP